MEKSFRQQTATALADYVQRISLPSLLAKYGSPLLILDAARITEQYRMMQEAFPGVLQYYALKALSHPTVIAQIQALDGHIDVASIGELAMVRAAQFNMDRVLYTHPIKRPDEIEAAYAAGVRLFVVDNVAELAKFEDIAPDAKVLIRLGFQNSDAQIDLSHKFGASVHEARELVEESLRRSIAVRGFSMHVGTQMPRADAYEIAVRTTLSLIDELERTHGIQFTFLDIGGGFPVQYQDPMPPIQEIADVVMPLLRPIMHRMTVMAEPGRIVAGPAVTAVMRVVGKSIRHGQPWYYVDDGLYGSYGGLIHWEGTMPLFVSQPELERTVGEEEYVVSALAGSTCDSTDMLTHDYLLPELQIGDYLLAPNMGAYSLVTATHFNGLTPATVVVVNEA